MDRAAINFIGLIVCFGIALVLPTVCFFTAASPTVIAQIANLWMLIGLPVFCFFGSVHPRTMGFQEIFGPVFIAIGFVVALIFLQDWNGSVCLMLSLFFALAFTYVSWLAGGLLGEPGFLIRLGISFACQLIAMAQAHQACATYCQ